MHCNCNTAQVMLAVEAGTGREYAVKMLDKRHIIKEKKVKYVNVEKSVLNRTNHAFIIRLFYTFQDQSSLCAWCWTHEAAHRLCNEVLTLDTRPTWPKRADFVLDLAPNGDLLDWIKKVARLGFITSGAPIRSRSPCAGVVTRGVGAGGAL